MATKRNINIEFDVDSKDLQSTGKQVSKISKTLNGLKGGAAKVFSALGKAGKSAFKGIGVAIKGAGIGLLLGILRTLWEAMKRNQVVMDVFETVVNGIGMVVKPLVEGITDLVTGLMNGSKEFDALGRVITNVINLAMTPLKVSFEAIKLAVNQTILTFLELKKKFGGKVDEGRIEELKGNIVESKDAIVELGTKAVDSFKSIVRDAKEAYNEVKTLAVTTVDGMTDAFNAAINGQAKAVTEARKQLALLDADQEKLKLIYQQRSEVLRQIRDDETKSEAERKKASKDLLSNLQEQLAMERVVVDQKIAAQRLILSLDEDNIEAQQKLQELLNQQYELDERITSQISEQKTSQNSLNKEYEKTAANVKIIGKETKKNSEEQEKSYSKIEGFLIKLSNGDYDEAIQLWGSKAVEALSVVGDIFTNIANKRQQELDDWLTANENVYKKIADMESSLSDERQSINTELITAEGSRYEQLQAQLESVNEREAINAADKKKLDQEEVRRKNLIADAEYKAAKAAKAASIIQATIDTTLAVIKTLADPPLSILVGILGAAGIATIASQPLPPKTAPIKLAGGGLLMGNSHAQGGIDIGGGYEAEGGEYVINKAATAAYLPLISKLNDSIKLANGGLVGAQTPNIGSGSADIVNYERLADAISRRPSYVSWTEGREVGNKVQFTENRNSI